MQNHNPPTVWTVPEQFRTIYTHAMEVPAGTRQLHVSGQFGVAPDGAMLPDFAGQLGQAMDNVEALLASARMGKADMVKATFFLTRKEDLPALGAARALGVGAAFGGDGDRRGGACPARCPRGNRSHCRGAGLRPVSDLT